MLREPLDMYRCIFAGKTVKNLGEIILMIREVTVNTNSKNMAAWNTIRFQPENNLNFWLVLLAKVSSCFTFVIQ